MHPTAYPESLNHKTEEKEKYPRSRRINACNDTVESTDHAARVSTQSTQPTIPRYHRTQTGVKFFLRVLTNSLPPIRDPAKHGNPRARPPLTDDSRRTRHDANTLPSFTRLTARSPEQRMGHWNYVQTALLQTMHCPVRPRFSTPSTKVLIPKPPSGPYRAQPGATQTSPTQRAFRSVITETHRPISFHPTKPAPTDGHCEHLIHRSV